MTTQQPESLRVSGLLRVTGHKAVSANMISDAILVIESQHARITELEAARFAYASEFAPTSDGDPDVSSIHANIRALKAQLAQRFDAADMATAAAQGFRDGATTPAQPVAEHVTAYAALPDGWVPLTITHEGQYPEEVAYGPQIMMDRIGKWLGKYFARAAQEDSVQEDAARLLALEAAANQIFNNPPSETSQDVRDVIEWFSGSIRVVLDAARKQGASHDNS